MHLDRGGTIAEAAGNVRSNLPATRQPVSQRLLHIKQYQDERVVPSMRGRRQPESRAALP